jgi:DNA-binding LytR/AlgR family response regulator
VIVYAGVATAHKTQITTITLLLSTYYEAFDTINQAVDLGFFDYVVNDAVFIKADNAYERVPYEDIYYVEANGNMVTIFTKNRNFTIRKSMKDMEEKLPSHLFLRVQKSFIVQLGQIESFNTKDITLHMGSVVQVGRQYYNSFLAKLNTITES